MALHIVHKIVNLRKTIWFGVEHIPDHPICDFDTYTVLSNNGYVTSLSESIIYKDNAITQSFCQEWENFWEKHYQRHSNEINSIAIRISYDNPFTNNTYEWIKLITPENVK